MFDQHAQLIVALDFDNADDALALATQLQPQRPWMKVGLELFTHAGPCVIGQLGELGLPVFLDGKFHDIPNTVAGAVRAAVKAGASMLNVHAGGGFRMMAAARAAADQAATGERPLVIAVTVLTSLSEHELRDELAVTRPLSEHVVQLALLAQDAGLDGVVASVHEVEAIKAACGSGFKVVTPGIRPSAVDDDQRRVATPAAAVAAGADYLVVGRPITQAVDPLAACTAVLAEMNN